MTQIFYKCENMSTMIREESVDNIFKIYSMTGELEGSTVVIGLKNSDCSENEPMYKTWNLYFQIDPVQGQIVIYDSSTKDSFREDLGNHKYWKEDLRELQVLDKYLFKEEDFGFSGLLTDWE